MAEIVDVLPRTMQQLGIMHDAFTQSPMPFSLRSFRPSWVNGGEMA